MKKYITFLIVIFIFSFLFFHYSKLIFAADTRNPAQILKVSPIILNVPLSPGKVYKEEISVENLTDRALPLRASLNDFQSTGEEGGYIFEESKTNPLLSWIKLSETDLILNPKEKKKVTMTITTPKNIPLGGYYGMLFFELVPQNNVINVTRVVPKIGVLLLANIGVPDPNAKKAEISTFSLGFFQENNHIPLLLRVKNISLHFFTAKPILTISPLLALHTQENPIYLEEKIVFQGKIRRWNYMLDLPNSYPNIYKAHMAVSTGNGQYEMEERYFVIFPFAKAIGIAVLIVVIVFFVIKRKRLGKAIQALYK